MNDVTNTKVTPPRGRTGVTGEVAAEQAGPTPEADGKHQVKVTLQSGKHIHTLTFASNPERRTSVRINRPGRRESTRRTKVSRDNTPGSQAENVQGKPDSGTGTAHKANAGKEEETP